MLPGNLAEMAELAKAKRFGVSQDDWRKVAARAVHTKGNAGLRRAGRKAATTKGPEGHRLAAKKAHATRRANEKCRKKRNQLSLLLRGSR